MKSDLAFLRHMAFEGVTGLHPGGAAGTQHLLQALTPRAGQCLLEIGCGTGSTLTHVAIRYGVRIIGIDILPEMLQVARRRIHWTKIHSRAAVSLANASTLPFPDGKFDGGYAESALGFHSVDIVRKILREMARVLRAGARFTANELVWRPGISAEEVQKVWHSARRDYGLAPALNEAWTWQDWNQEFQAAGFSVVANQAFDHGTPIPWHHPREYPSFALTGLYKIRGFLSPRHVREDVVYKKSMQPRPILEPRLFVLEKT